MIRQVRAELAKVLTTRMVWGLLAGYLGFVLITVAATVGFEGGPEIPALDTPEGLQSLFASASTGTVFTLVLGVLAVTGEYRHGTVTSTFLVVPQRGRVLLAKVLALPLVAFGYAVLGVALTAVVGYGVAWWKDIDVASINPDIPVVLVGSLASVTLYAMFGVGFGALIRNQVAAVITALLWVLLIESALVGFLPEVGRWTPGGAASAMTLVEPQRGSDLLGPLAGTLLFVAYCLALVFVGARLTMRRDIT